MSLVNTDTPLTVNDSFFEKETELFSSLKLKIEDLAVIVHKLNELIEEIGTGLFGGDSQNHRKTISSLKQRALNLSKKIHEEILKEEEELKKDEQTVNKRSSKLQLRKLSLNYSNLLEKLEEMIKNLKNLTKKHPIILVTPKNQTKESKKEESLLTKSFILEEVPVDEEDEFEGLDNLDGDIDELVEIFQIVNKDVKLQEEKLELIQDQIDDSNVDIEKGTSDLKQASAYGTTFALTALGGTVGLLVGGPLGLAAVGLKTGLTLGFGFGAAGLVAGYKGSDLLNKKNPNTVQEEKKKQ
eukprot:gene1267-11354_t